MDKRIFPSNVLDENLEIIINSDFTYIIAGDSTIPYQGWKIHISATLENYQKILDTVTDICRKQNVDFKFVNNLNRLFLLFSKGASQTEIGKFITIYPENDSLFLKLLDILYQNLTYEQGIQVTTDRSYKKSEVIFYRYGVMNAPLTDEGRPFITDNLGNKYPDIIGPYYHCPEFIDEHFIDEDTTDVAPLLNNRYDMREIIHQTGAGNVYIAIDSVTGKKVIIKEARKYVYATKDLTAIHLLTNEKNILKSFSEFELPKYIDDFYSDSNYYLVEEFIEGKTLSSLKDRFNILINRPTSEKEQCDKDIENLILTLFKSLENLHNKGLILEDISLSNIMLTSNDEIKFIDFETGYLKIDGPHISATNHCYPDNINADFEKKDRIKLWYCIIALLTNASSLLKFDRTGRATVQLFIRMYLEMDGPKKLLDILSKDLKVEWRDTMLFINYLKLGIDIEKMVHKRDEILRTVAFHPRFTIEGASWIEKVENYNAIKNMGFLPAEEIEQTNLTGNDIDTELARMILSPKEGLNLSPWIAVNDLNSMDYKYKYTILTLLNANPHPSYLFRSVVQSIISNNIHYKEGVPYIKEGEYSLPYLINGNAGLIIELIKFSLAEGSTEYDSFIAELGKGVAHPYAKSTNLYSGLAGLGLANSWLYHYFKKISYLQIALTIFNHICDYSIKKNNKLFLIDPLNETINYSFSRGILGQLYFLDQMIQFIKRG